MIRQTRNANAVILIAATATTAACISPANALSCPQITYILATNTSSDTSGGDLGLWIPGLGGIGSDTCKQAPTIIVGPDDAIGFVHKKLFGFDIDPEKTKPVSEICPPNAPCIPVINPLPITGDDTDADWSKTINALLKNPQGTDAWTAFMEDQGLIIKGSVKEYPDLLAAALKKDNARIEEPSDSMNVLYGYLEDEGGASPLSEWLVGQIDVREAAENSSDDEAAEIWQRWNALASMASVAPSEGAVADGTEGSESDFKNAEVEIEDIMPSPDKLEAHEQVPPEEQPSLTDAVSVDGEQAEHVANEVLFTALGATLGFRGAILLEMALWHNSAGESGVTDDASPRAED